MAPMIGLDGDDTLWHSESHFVTTTERLVDLLGAYLDDGADAEEHLIEVERRNLELFGYGVKAFTLSMIETAIEVSAQRITAEEIHRIVGWSKELMDHPVDLIDGVSETVEDLARDHTLVLVTKGDLLHQESKVARSGIERHFDGIHIVSEKDTATYHRVLESHGVEPQEFVMVGNSLRSDILPVVELGGRGIHVPYHTTWALERVDDAELPQGVERVDDLRMLRDVLGI
ncbi:MAG: HAD family hydrolase [Microthrixaceae bacterium]